MANRLSHLPSDLQALMAELYIFETDLEEQFTHSSGAGGQNVNKVATCVHLQHNPTGTRVKCSVHRTQRANRIEARRQICQKFLDSIADAAAESKRQAWEERSRKRKPSPTQRDRRLQQKKLVSQKKLGRKNVTE
jgi:protein subunit release factor B